jgi:hypothetical protein
MFKKLLENMGLLSKKIAVGQEAIDKANNKQPSSDKLTEQEVNFILTKLRQANYTGAEFEMFHTVWMKISNLK